MTNNELVQLFQYIGVPEDRLELVCTKMYYWDFVESLSGGLVEYGTLTPKQKEALVRLVAKHTNTACSDEHVIQHTTKYESKGGGSGSSKRTLHDFGKLEVIQLYDLPFTSGSTYTIKFYPYNANSIVTSIRGVYYKIPKPVLWAKFNEPIRVEFTYKRTEMKGFMTKVAKEENKQTSTS